MLSLVLKVVLGAVGGAAFGLFAAFPGMRLAGGGNSHNDIAIAIFWAMTGAVVGGIVGPVLLRALFRGFDPSAPSEQDRAKPSGLIGALSALGFLASAFGACSAHYHAAFIARLPVDRGGPVDNPDPDARALLAYALAIALGVLATGCVLIAAREGARRGSE